jgi:crotonobetaine/carnitine-CoA ligase
MIRRDMEGGTIGSVLRARSATIPHKPLLVSSRGTMTYGEVDALADDVANAWRALGRSKGDLVCLMAGNHPEFVLAWFGCARAGLVQVPINTAYKGDLLTYVLEHSTAKSIVIDPALLGNLLSARSVLNRMEHLVFTGDVPQEAHLLGVPSVLSWHEFVDLGARQRSRDAVVGPGDLATLMYTSGTTGPSKGVMTSHLHNLTQGFEAAQALRMTVRDVLYTCMPLFHGNAQWATVLNALSVGATFALGERFSASGFWREASGFGATECNLIGSMMYMLAAQEPSDGDRDHRIKTVFAAPAPADIFYRFEARFQVTVIEGYGLTETKNVAYNPYDARRPGSFGKPTPSTILTILGPAGEELPAGEVGEIAYRPRTADIVCLGYFRDPEATLRAMKDLWWHTGDLGFRDEDGYFYFVDRLKDAIRRRGENISSFELERTLLAHPDVLDAAVVAVPSEVAEEEVMAIIVPRSGVNISPEELFTYCDGRLPYFMVPRYYRQVEVLPRTPNDKVRKVELRQQGITADTWDSAKAGFKPTRTIL